MITKTTYICDSSDNSDCSDSTDSSDNSDSSDSSDQQLFFFKITPFHTQTNTKNHTKNLLHQKFSFQKTFLQFTTVTVKSQGIVVDCKSLDFA